MEAFVQQGLISGELTLTLILAVLATGVLTSLSPCVYPLLPITVSTVGAFNDNGKKQALGHALVYVSGLAFVYGGLGVIAALTGQLFGSVASHPLTLIIVANILLLFAAWMMGWIQLPGWQPELSLEKVRRYRLFYLFGLGGFSGLVAAPCTSPVLGMLLMFVAANGSPTFGAILLIIFAYGMCSLLIIAGTFGGVLKSLPRSGHWLTGIKILLSLMLAGVAQYLLLLAGKGI